MVFLRTNGPATVRRVRRHHEWTRTCNLTVRGLHTFAVGEAQVLVHNSALFALAKPLPDVASTAEADAGVQVAAGHDPNALVGPAGFGTPDDVEAIEASQRGYKGAEDYGGWNDISAGVSPKDPASFIKHGDEGRMRVFWTKWQEYLSN